MSRISKRKRIHMCMASVMCMLLLLIPLPVSANNQGSILLKATVEDEAAVYHKIITEQHSYIIICILSTHKELLPPNHNNIDT